MNHGIASVADEYLFAQRQMEDLYGGASLRKAADDVLLQLPPGPLVLLATSLPGAGLAATCAALREDQTVWSRVTLTHDQPLHGPGGVVFVEPIEPEASWLEVMSHRHPDAVVVTPRRASLLVAA